MSQQEQFPFAPLVERCFELAVDIVDEQFEEEAGAFMAAVGKELDLSEHKTIEHWEIRIDKPKGGMPPKPKATLYSVPTISRPEKSVKGNQSIETLHFIPATESGLAKLKYAQLKPQDGPIMSFTDSTKRLNTILEVLREKLGIDVVRQTTVAYWNDLKRLNHSFFKSDGGFILSNALMYFKRVLGEGDEKLVPPWNVAMNWTVPARPGAVLHMDIKGDWKAAHPVWVILGYQGQLSEQGILLVDCQKELDIAHTAIYEKFLSLLTPEALRFCKNGSINDPAPEH